VGIGVPSWGKLTGGGICDHSYPSSTKVENELSYTSSPHMCFHGVDRHTFTFTQEYLLASGQILNLLNISLQETFLLVVSIILIIFF
jgi:hypothetical protein